MRKLLLAGVAGILSATGAYAAPINASTTITNGAFTFSNFSCTNPTSNGTTSSPGGSSGACSNLTVIPTVGSNGTSGNGIEFQGLLLASSNASSSTSSLDVVLGYQVTSATPFSTITLSFDGDTTAGTNADAAVVESVSMASTGASVGQTSVSTPGAVQSTLTLSSAQTSVLVKKDVSVFAPSGSVARISLIDQTIGGTGGGGPGTPTPAPTPTPTPSAVPEPVSLALLGSGLVGLGLMRRTKRS